MNRYTLVMPTFNDFDNVWGTVQHAWEFHGEHLEEIIVVDNNPTGPQASTLIAFCNMGHKVRYIPFNLNRGTAPSKGMAIASANTDRVVCVDSHVVIGRGAFDALNEFYDANPSAKNDLVHGPLVYTNRVDHSTHFTDVWQGEMWGVWGHDVRRYTHKWFEIQAQGMGCFAVHKSTWPGFNPYFRGFGGEEWYIHEKYRQQGGKVWCVSGFRWIHNFGKPAGNRAPVIRYEKLRNYCIGLQELNIPLDRCKEHFLASGLVDQATWDAAVRGDDDPPVAPCNTCNQPAPDIDIDAWYDKAKNTANDINEHCDTLKALASKCNVVVDMGVRNGTHSVAFAAGHPKHLVIVGTKEPGELASLTKNAKDTKVQFVQGDSTTVQIPDADLVFIDTEPHNADHVYAELVNVKPHAKRYIVVHDTEAPFGETGQGGDKLPGVMAGVRRFAQEHDGWVVIRHYVNNHGLTVLSCDPADHPPGLPPLWKQAINYGKSEIKDIANGRKRVSLQVATERYAICTSNGGRCPAEQRIIDLDRCANCGCHLMEQPGEGEQTGKVWRPLDSCRLGYWGPHVEAAN
jgi:hypothetical protein